MVLSQAIAVPVGDQRVFGFRLLNPLPCCGGQGDVWIPYETYARGPKGWGLASTLAGATRVLCSPGDLLPPPRTCKIGDLQPTDVETYLDNLPPSSDPDQLAKQVVAALLGLDDKTPVSVTRFSERLRVSLDQIKTAAQAREATFRGLLAQPALSGTRVRAYEVATAVALLGNVVLRPDGSGQWTVEAFEGIEAAKMHPVPTSVEDWVEIEIMESGEMVGGSTRTSGLYVTEIQLAGTECTSAPATTVKKLLTEAYDKSPMQ